MNHSFRYVYIYAYLNTYIHSILNCIYTYIYANVNMKQTYQINIYIYKIYSWNPNNLYFWRSTPQNKAFSNQNKAHWVPGIYKYINIFVIYIHHPTDLSWGRHSKRPFCCCFFFRRENCRGRWRDSRKLQQDPRFPVHHSWNVAKKQQNPKSGEGLRCFFFKSSIAVSCLVVFCCVLCCCVLFC